MLRLRDESGVLVAPAEFIPAAERYNVMPSIDRWVVRQALDRVVHRISSGVKPYTVAVNLSGTSLNDERFLEYLIAELSAVELVPGAMCFEITETAAIANLGNVVYFMRELKARGCHFALDDFGSGLSSFMYLKNLPVDYLKIDGQFIENVTRDPVDRSMVEAISQIGKAMGIQTIAERVESAEVLAELGRLGVGFAQGLSHRKAAIDGRIPLHQVSPGGHRRSGHDVRAAEILPFVARHLDPLTVLQLRYLVHFRLVHRHHAVLVADPEIDVVNLVLGADDAKIGTRKIVPIVVELAHRLMGVDELQVELLAGLVILDLEHPVVPCGLHASRFSRPPT